MSDRKKTCPICCQSATKSKPTIATTRTTYWISRRRLARWRGDGPRRAGGARVVTLIAKPPEIGRVEPQSSGFLGCRRPQFKSREVGGGRASRLRGLDAKPLLVDGVIAALGP